MHKINTLLFLSFLFFIGCAEKPTPKPLTQITKIAFGSCGREYEPLPIFNRIIEHEPDMFIFLGDNIYGDTKIMDTLRAKYARLEAKESFQNLIQNTEILATWDDHDFGWNDAGREYEFKEEAKEIFLDFFNESDTSSRRKHRGIYHSYDYTIGDKKLQVILLDNRTFRDKLKPYNGEFDDDRRYSFYRTDYAPHTTPDSTFLGQQQWEWLDLQLQKPADIRLIGSGSQFGIEWNGYEAWANYPHEQQKMLDLIKKNKANGVIFLTGDVHYSEISKLKTDFYPIYDFTSSGLSSTWHFATPNENRIEGPIMDNHFGLITIDWLATHPEIKMETWDIRDNQRIEFTVSLDEISFK
ncbi:MAG: alkaline phosphatase D [Saprospiraceae bacterium]|jgi:alkaline phosphatase D